MQTGASVPFQLMGAPGVVDPDEDRLATTHHAVSVVVKDQVALGSNVPLPEADGRFRSSVSHDVAE